MINERSHLVTQVTRAAPAVSQAVLGVVTRVRSGDQETTSKGWLSPSLFKIQLLIFAIRL